MPDFILWILCAVFGGLAVLNGLHFSSIFLILAAIFLIPLFPVRQLILHLFEKQIIPILLAFLIAFCGIGFYPALSINNVSSSSSESLFNVDISSNAESKKTLSTNIISSSNQKDNTITTSSPNTSTNTESQMSEHKLEILSLTSTVGNGQTATIEIRGEPSCNYSIDVYYSESKSTAKGLEDKVSDKDGKVSWSWKVGNRTKPGNYKIIITSESGKFETYFTVE